MSEEKELHIEKIKSFVKGLVPENQVHRIGEGECDWAMVEAWDNCREEILKNIEDANWDNILN